MNKQQSTIKFNVVLVGGCFDLLHYGHVAFLRHAKTYGSKLIVALESDENVRRMKGPTRPIHTQQQRAEMLEALTFVNEVIQLPKMEKDEDYIALVDRIHPDIIAVTEGDPALTKKQTQADKINAKIIVIPKIHTPSTSQLAKLLELE